MTIYSYLRVSTSDGSQTVDSQRHAISAAGHEVDWEFVDHATGTNVNRPALTELLATVVS
ncbi:MAG: recombinase family protein [Planctomycetota bacterium]|nr:recombinase family protein [Planctomycetota bacterium]